MADPRAGQPAAPDDLVNVAKLVTAYYAVHPDPGDPAQRVGEVDPDALPSRAVKVGDRPAAVVAQHPDPLGPHLYSEVLFLKLRVALAEGKKHDADWAGEQLGMPPRGHDPGVMLRARRLLGPLYLLRG